MTFALRRERQPDERPVAAGAEARPEARLTDELARILSRSRAGEEKGPASRAAEGAERADWSTALELVQQTVRALRASGERARQLEERMQAVIQRASDELEAAHTRIEVLETRLREADAREKRAEARAREADDWLQRIHSTLAEELPTELRQPTDFLAAEPEAPGEPTPATLRAV